MILTGIFIQYLLFPLIAFAMIGVMILLKKKNDFIQNKRLVVYPLVAVLILAIPGIGGMLGNKFSPWGYLAAQLFYLVLGRWHVGLLHHYFTGDRTTVVPTDEQREARSYAIFFEIAITILIMAIGGYIFSFLFNWLSPYKGYNIVAVTCILSFIVPLLFHYTYRSFVAIPFAIYSVWEVPKEKNDDNIISGDIGNLTVVNLELTKTTHDGRRITLQVKAPENIPFGDWMHRVLMDHKEKNQSDRIDTATEDGNPYGWVFYIKPSFFRPRQYLDFEKTIAQNHIKRKHMVVCRRVINGEEEKIIALGTPNK
ncbi:TssN family type VI secretion system protein [Taibaiella soli]|uniref:TssN family type VI secretion system protein n=1 Tax=Taibaiella soli TaxID=1649169 RepID=A0A2W2BA20_9BACT|nr:TssN family type VI secretion system protein [Taibaiella soli]PZF72747.1 hypothetical protein DN068_12875 [Taibaiella soli]